MTLRSQYEPKWLHTVTSKYALVLVWAAMALVYYILMPHSFGSIGAVRAIFGGQPVLVFLAMSALITLLVAEFDLSVASIMGLAATIVPVLAGLHGVNIWVACLIALAACMVAGAINAFFVVYLDVSSFVVTLGTGTLLIGLSQWISSSNVVSFQDDMFSKIAPAARPRHAGVVLLRHRRWRCSSPTSWPTPRSAGTCSSSGRTARSRASRASGSTGSAPAPTSSSSLLAGFAGHHPGLRPRRLRLRRAPGSSCSRRSPRSSSAPTVVQPGQFNPIGTMIAIWFLWTGIFGLQLLGFAGWVQNVFYGAGLVVAVALAEGRALAVHDRLTLSSTYARARSPPGSGPLAVSLARPSGSACSGRAEHGAREGVHMLARFL